MKISENHKLKNSYRNIFLVQDRNFWDSCPFNYDRELDLVLTFDFALLKFISSKGADVFYLDHILNSDYMEGLHKETYEFISKWYLDGSGKDIFSYKGIDMGLSFREEIWDDVISSVRISAGCIALKGIRYERMFVGLDDNVVLGILDFLSIKFESWPVKENKNKVFYVQDFRHLKANSLFSCKKILRSCLSALLDLSFFVIDNSRMNKLSKSAIYAINYYPTKDIISQLINDKRFIIVKDEYTQGKGILRQRRLPKARLRLSYRHLSRELLSAFARKKVHNLDIEGIRISDFIYKLIMRRVRSTLPECLQYVDNINLFFNKKALKLMITVSSLGIKNCLMLDYCRKKNIPTYNIQNGLLLHSFYEEDNKNLSWINSYGESIKRDYYRNAGNIVCLGDPRLDRYVNEKEQREDYPKTRRLLIGSYGFSVIDLNSYRAIEFEYLFDLLHACKALKDSGKQLDISIKLHPQCDRRQYVDFLQIYFPDFPVNLYDGVSLADALHNSDCYISSCSGTVFEASLLGIPVLYYKIDEETLISPYNGNSDLVTASSPEDLLRKLELLYENNGMYGLFKKKSVMERYVGPLDGKNSERNLKFIYSLIGE